MKQFIAILLIAASFISCEEKINDFVSISGHIDNLEANDTLIKVSATKYSKTIKVDSDGNFSDTLHIEKPNFYSFSLTPTTRFTTFLTTGDNLKLEGDAKDLNNTLAFKGRGEFTNNYLLTRVKEVALLSNNTSELYALDSLEFNKKMTDFESKMNSLLNNKKLDSTVAVREKQGLKGYMKSMISKYNKQHAMQTTFAKGKASPKFVNFENYKGGTTSLDDLKGKYVYIDVWATWCRPCLNQIPALKELEEEYKGKNIEFVSISTDKPNKHEAWKNMIVSKAMSGIQLYAGADQSFMQEYQINSIPRFIFIDTKGNIIDANAPRPSQKEAITKLFTEVGL
ncbi:MAG TPA: TlpA family protein disulfide reductase [Lutibacter sp.]|nr:TlpA family protein disulfide reductase [Lutibacter sp.]